VNTAIRVKVCGITTRDDARAAIDRGVDALGFLVGLLHASEDELTATDARKIVETLPPFVVAVLVTHRHDPADVRELVREVRPHAVQLQGAFPLDDIPALRESCGVRTVKVVHVEGEASVSAAVEAARHADAVLLDTKTPTRIGGTGLTHDWALSRRIRDEIDPVPVILAGGLTPDNVARAIQQVNPYAVDANSGVSVRRGQKSPELVDRFVRAARGDR
jgi:phosphoribosylanthranilate isomerase